MRFGRASHLYAGATRRGRSERTVVGLGLAKAWGSLGQARVSLELDDERKVGLPNAAAFV